MSQAEKMRLAAQIIAYGSAAAPSKFPKDDEIVLKVWADVLETVNLPEDIWPEAIRYWAATNQDGNMAGPWNVLNAAKEVIKQWERDESKKYILEAHRWQHRVARAKHNYGSEFTLDKVVPPPHWTGIDTTQDPTGRGTREIAREGWHRAQQQPPAIEVQPDEFFARMKRNLNATQLERAIDAAKQGLGATQSDKHATHGQSVQKDNPTPQKRNEPPF